MPVTALLKTANENFRQLERPSFSFFEVLPDHQRFKSGERGYACRAPGMCIEEMRLGGIRTNLLFTMSDITRATAEAAGANFVFSKRTRCGLLVADRKFGGARRNRTDDLMLAKHALSQLSYGP
jgi:hypothetical protein